MLQEKIPVDLGAEAGVINDDVERLQGEGERVVLNSRVPPRVALLDALERQNVQEDALPLGQARRPEARSCLARCGSRRLRDVIAEPRIRVLVKKPMFSARSSQFVILSMRLVRRSGPDKNERQAASRRSAYFLPAQRAMLQSLMITRYLDPG